ncbi:hypothetical protein ACTXT7_002378 [Hymenolepis weldensis]
MGHPHVRLRESERRCALESLRYEELLLELESSRMRQKYENFEPITIAAIGGGGGHSTSISPAALAVSIPSSNDLADLTGAYKNPLPNDLSMVFKHQFSEESQNNNWLSSNLGNCQTDGDWILPTRDKDGIKSIYVLSRAATNALQT